MQLNFTTLSKQKINNIQVKIFCLVEPLVSSRPVNADFSSIEMSQMENKYDYDIIRDNSEFSLLEFGIHFGAPLVLALQWRLATNAHSFPYGTPFHFLIANF
jgi:hypothetical protein